jgi:hypothetical protein
LKPTAQGSTGAISSPHPGCNARRANSSTNAVPGAEGHQPHNPQPAALSDPARLLTKEETMKILDTIFAVLAWTVFGIVIWAVSPFLMKLMEMATNLHNLFK